MSFKDDLERDLDEIFLNDDEFAEKATLHSLTISEGIKVKAIFDEAFELVNFEGEITAIVPSLLVKESDVKKFPKDNPLMNVTIRNKVHGVMERRPQGDGMTLLILGDMRKR